MEIILFTAIAILFLFIVLSHKLHSKEIQRLHSDVRKSRESLFWSQKRERVIKDYVKRVRKTQKL